MFTLISTVPLFAETAGAGSTVPADTGKLESSFSGEKSESSKESGKKRFLFNADFRFREAYQGNIKSLNSDPPESDWFRQRYRLRGSLAFTPHENLEFNTRVVWEFRHYHGRGLDKPADWSYGLFDGMNITWRNAFGLPLKITAGRQDINLDSGWLVSDGTPKDGSRGVFIDAVRADYELDRIGSTFKVIYINHGARADSRLPTFPDRDNYYLVEEDQQGAVFHFANSSLNKLDIHTYFMTKDSTARTSTGWTGDTYTFGGGATWSPHANWALFGEAAGQTGTRNGRDISASGALTEITCLFNDKFNNRISSGYHYFSGDNPDTAADETFDVMWGRNDSWSKLYPYIIKLDNGRDAQFENTKRIFLAWNSTFKRQLNLTATCNFMFAGANPYDTYTSGLTSEHGNYRGFLWTARLNYKMTRHVTGHFLAERFHPGNYYSASRQDPASMARFEISFLW